MKNQNNSLPEEIYSTCLEKINDVRFTRREIDIISFMVSGRSAKKTASFFSLSPKTVESYTHNIMVKLECSSRESIIDFVERSEQFRNIKRYYASLLLESSFESQLKDIFLTIGKKQLLSLTVYWQEVGCSYSSFVHYLIKHLKFMGIEVSLEICGEGQFLTQMLPKRNHQPNFRIYVLSNALINELKSQPDFSFSQIVTQRNNLLLLFLEDINTKEILHDLEGFAYLELNKQKDYYGTIFAILQRVFPHINLEKFYLAFEAKCSTLQDASNLAPAQISLKDGSLEKETNCVSRWDQAKKLLIEYRIISVSLLLWLTIGGGNYLVFFSTREKNQASEPPLSENLSHSTQVSIRSDLVTPNEPFLLNRFEILNQIDSEFKKQKEKIQTVALIGIGGAGKTTLARKVAHAQSDPLVWEIQAKTKESTKRSFEYLAQALATTEEEKRGIQDIQEMKTPEIREPKILLFVKNKLKALSSWVLLYDNLENLVEILPYIPQREGDWGQGKMLITTRNSHLQNSPFVHSVVPIHALTAQEKFSLFKKIIGDQVSSTTGQWQEIEKLLEDIPPFPLDVSLAAYYLKTTHVSPEKYRDYLNTHNPNFIVVQENILHETGAYFKARYEIITLSLQQILKVHKDFEDLLILISLIDSQRIPRSVLEKFKDGATVDRFLYQLQQYSLITYDPVSVLGSTFSLHHSTHNISHTYLMNAFNSKNDFQRLNAIAQVFEAYLTETVNKNYFQGGETPVNHVKAFLNQKFLSSSMKGSLNYLLGRFYYYLGEYRVAKDILKESLIAFKQEKTNKEEDVFKTVMAIGNTYRELGQYEEAQNLFEHHLSKHPKNPHHNLIVAKGFIYLGMLYRERGFYIKAQEAFTQALTFYEKYVPRDPVRESWAKAQLGTVYKNLGRYQDARAFLEQSLDVYQKHLPGNHTFLSWICMVLGNLYESIGEYEKARSCYERSLSICKKQMFQNFISKGWALSALGSISQKMNNLQEAKDFLEQALNFYRKTLPADHIYIINDVYLPLGKVYQALHQPSKAKNLFEKVLKVHEKHYGEGHKTAWTLRYLGQFYLHENQLKEAEDILFRALSILQKIRHPRMYLIYEDLADLTDEKFRLVKNEGKEALADTLRVQAAIYLKKAYEGIKTHFPETSAYFKRIQSKLDIATF